VVKGGSFDELLPVFRDVRRRCEVGTRTPRRPPGPGSAMAGDDSRLPGFPPSTLIVSSLDVAIEQIHALSVLFIDAQLAHPHVPLTLLRASLEDASRALWLIAPDSRPERLLRALRVWHQDFGDRAEYEQSKPQEPGRKTGRERQQEMRDKAMAFGLPADTVAGSLPATSMIRRAGELIRVRRKVVFAGQAAGRGFGCWFGAGGSRPGRGGCWRADGGVL
jgi:hypothetical protein